MSYINIYNVHASDYNNIHIFRSFQILLNDVLSFFDSRIGSNGMMEDIDSSCLWTGGWCVQEMDM